MASASQPLRAGTARALPVLCIDLDGTLVSTDVFVESLLQRAFSSPGALVEVCRMLTLRSRAHCKKEMSASAPTDPALLPYCKPLLDYVREARASGREIALVTGASAETARLVAQHLGIFDHVISSDSECNLTGRRKLDTLIARFGTSGFEYAGNSASDVPVWAHCGRALVVNPTPAARFWLALRRIPVYKEFREQGKLLAYMRAARPYQWSKNALVFAPLLLSHRWSDAPSAAGAVAAAAAMSLCASSAYFLNDLLDVNEDRRHPKKRCRPLAAGLITPHGAVLASALCLAAGAAIGWNFGTGLLLLLGLYTVTTIAYSMWLKKIFYLDVLVLCGLYILRIFAGGLATGAAISPWLIQFSLYAFLSLSIAKRYSELAAASAEQRTANLRRGYLPGDAEQLVTVGTASALLSVLVVALYVNSDAVLTLYSRPAVLWILCPLLLYWFLRFWSLLRRGMPIEDPVRFALTDRPTQITGLLCLVFLLIAI